MTNILLTRDEMGSNTHFILKHMKDTIRVKSGALPIQEEPEWIIRWGCRAKMPNGPKVLNRVSAIKETTAKGLFRKKVHDAGYAPGTWLDITTWFIDGMMLPVIVRPVFHQRSEALYFCTTADEVRDAVVELGEKDYYISEYIAKKKEWRVFMAQGRVMIVAEKLPKDRKAVTWGCVEDGELDYVAWGDWNLDLIRCASASFDLTKLDFAAVDIMELDGRFYFLEMNTAPEVWAYYGRKFADVFNYIIANDNRDRIAVAGFDNWRKLIHPAISANAIIE